MFGELKLEIKLLGAKKCKPEIALEAWMGAPLWFADKDFSKILF